jgi:phosphate transport system substrate-binding protein
LKLHPVRRTKRTLAILTFTLVSCSSPVLPASTPTTEQITLRLYATTATMPLLNELTTRYSGSHPAVLFETMSGNHQVMLERLLAGEMPYFLSSHLALENDLWAAPIGQDGIAVIVHPDNQVDNLTTDQIRRVYQGLISNWMELDGSNLGIDVISREAGAGTRAEFERLVMGERRTTLSAQVAPSSSDMMTSVAAQPGGIGYVSMSFLDDTVKAIQVDDVPVTQETVYESVYPLRSTLYIIGLAEAAGHYRAFIGWIQSPEGQAAVAELYAPLLRP